MNKEIASADCNGCGSSITMKLNKNGRAYYYCNNCGHHERYGLNNTKNILEKLEGKQDEKPETNSNGKNIDRAGSEPRGGEPEERPATESGASDDSGGSDDSGSGIFGIF